MYNYFNQKHFNIFITKKISFELAKYCNAGNKVFLVLQLYVLYVHCTAWVWFVDKYSGRPIYNARPKYKASPSLCWFPLQKIFFFPIFFHYLKIMVINYKFTNLKHIMMIPSYIIRHQKKLFFFRPQKQYRHRRFRHTT